MPRQQTTNVENSFIKGLITEATGLNFPENACTSTDNCVFGLTGDVRRRLGIDFEDKFQTTHVDRSEVAMSSFLWGDVAQDATVSLEVIQVGSTLYFFDVFNYPNISLGLLPDVIDLTDHIPDGGPDPSQDECQFANGHGVLFVYHPTLDPFYIEYNSDDRSLTATEISIMQRDFEGEDDGLDVAKRPSTSFTGLSHKHHYNLLNQGWTDTNLQTWDNNRSDMPSDADVMWLFKNADDQFDTSTVDDMSTISGNSPAPNGHFIFSVFNQDRVTVSGISDLDITTTDFKRVSTGAFFAGRVWYAGINAPKYRGRIYFSPIIEKFEDFGKCYQINDPTSATLFDLLPSDGGVIDIADAGNVFKLVAVQNYLLVFANNGVWAITGSSGVGFTATDYSVQKIAEIPSISNSSFVNVAGFPMWWNYDGIYSIVPTQAGTLSAQTLTDTTIKTYFDTIPEQSKLYARGAFNNLTKTVQWLFRDTVGQSIDETYNFNHILNYNILTQAFFTWSFQNTEPRLNDMFFVSSVGESLDVDDVIDESSNLVIDESSNQVVTYERSGLIESRFIYISTYTGDAGNPQLVFAIEKDTAYGDFASSLTGITQFDSSFTTGYKVHGQGNRKFQTSYVFLYVNNTDPGVFYIRNLWDFATASSTGRWSSKQRITSDGQDYAYSTRRVKLRGHGLVCQFQVTSEPGQPFDIVGWSVFESVDQWV